VKAKEPGIKIPGSFFELKVVCLEAISEMSHQLRMSHEDLPAGRQGRKGLEFQQQSESLRPSRLGVSIFQR